jgi:hypothetical protein
MRAKPLLAVVTFAATAVFWWIVIFVSNPAVVSAFRIAGITSRGRRIRFGVLGPKSYATPPPIATAESALSPDRQQQSPLFTWGPPPPIRDLKVGETHVAYDAFNITKVCEEPPIFILRNLLTTSERTTLIDESQILWSSSNSSSSRFNPAKVSAGVIDPHHRTKSSVAWISENDHPIVEFMTQLTARIFCHFDHIRSGHVQAERLQIVRYEPDGKFDLHHDGYNRTVTVLTYMNGIAGTWFPYVGAPYTDMPTIKLQGNTDTLLRNKQPGHHGLLIVGDEVAPEENGSPESTYHPHHVVRIHPGDAVAFYNYEPSWYHQYHDAPRLPIQMAWRSLHCGLPAKSTKWIATNWFTTTV